MMIFSNALSTKNTVIFALRVSENQRKFDLMILRPLRLDKLKCSIKMLIDFISHGLLHSGLKRVGIGYIKTHEVMYDLPTDS